jgi:hypothetical protein
MTLASGDGIFWADEPAAREQVLRFDDDQTVAELVPAEWAGVDLLDGLAVADGRCVTVRLTDGSQVGGRVDEVGDGWFSVCDAQAVTLIVTTSVASVRGLPTAAPVERLDRRLRQSAVWRQWARQRAYVQVHVGGIATYAGTVRRVGRDFVDLLEHPGDRVPTPLDRSVVVPFAAVTSASAALA